jgi:hypothetical protein
MGGSAGMTLVDAGLILFMSHDFSILIAESTDEPDIHNNENCFTDCS